MRAAPSKLFHAVVVLGAALTGTALTECSSSSTGTPDGGTAAVVPTDGAVDGSYPQIMEDSGYAMIYSPPPPPPVDAGKGDAGYPNIDSGAGDAASRPDAYPLIMPPPPGH